jgi:hypothetical protein
VQRYKGEVFVNPHIKAVLNDRNFDEILGKSDKSAWEAFILVNLKMLIHRQLVVCMHQAYVRNGRCMLLKIHFILTCTWKFTSFWNVILHVWVKSNVRRDPVNFPEHLNLQQHYWEKIKSLLGVYRMNTGDVNGMKAV